MSTEIPKLRYSQIGKCASDIREEYNITDNKFELSKFIEWDLGIRVTPKKGLKYFLDLGALAAMEDYSSEQLYFEQPLEVDASLDHNLKIMFVDEDLYDSDNQNRIRFSMAHELGHYFLHKQIIIENQPNYKNFFLELKEEDHNMIERQADEFAGRFLVPKNLLQTELEKQLDILEQNKLSMNRISLGFVCDQIGKEFLVSAKVIEIRLKREGFWSDEDGLTL